MKTVYSMQQAASLAILHSEKEEGKPVAKSSWQRAKNSAAANTLKNKNDEDEDTDSDGMDCLVANETLQFSANDRNRRKSPEIRKITKRTSFVKNNNFKRISNLKSFCTTKTSTAGRGGRGE